MNNHKLPENEPSKHLRKSVLTILFNDALKEAEKEGDVEKIEVIKRVIRRIENI